MLDIALKLINKISESGFEAYIVGGFVRDYLLGLKSNDIDICTNATPRELKEIFEDDLESNEDYGTVTIIYHNIRFDIATFRKDIGYNDNRRPDKVEYIDDLYEDLKRRDFSINTFCIDKDNNIIDYFNAKKDLDNRLIKCIGDPVTKFNEDALRILRCIRFATVLDFNIDKDTEDAIFKCRSKIKNLSYYRKKEELDKIFISKNSMYGIKLLLKYKLDKELEIENLNKVKESNNLIGVWAVLNCPKYPFTSVEKEQIKKINEILDKNHLDPMNLYKYGLYINSVAGEIKGEDISKIAESYDNLVIEHRKDIDIDAEGIMEIFNKKPGRYINEIFELLENAILYRRVKNNREDIIKYIKNNYKMGE